MAEYLIRSLSAAVHATQPEDPFQSIPIVVGSRGMERWIRHELATLSTIAAGLDFVFPRQALDGATKWLLNSHRDPQADFGVAKRV